MLTWPKRKEKAKEKGNGPNGITNGEMSARLHKVGVRGKGPDSTGGIMVGANGQMGIAKDLTTCGHGKKNQRDHRFGQIDREGGE